MTSAHESLAFRSAVQLAQSIASGRLRSAALVEHYLERIARYDAKLHAFVEVYADDARNAADAADLAIDAGHAVGPLHGLPVALKDLVDMQGRVTSGGCKLWAQRVSPKTATLAKRLIGAGMKSNPGVAAQMFETLAEAGINIQMLSTSGIRISAIVGADETEQAVGVLHDAFELARPVN